MFRQTTSTHIARSCASDRSVNTRGNYAADALAIVCVCYCVRCVDELAVFDCMLECISSSRLIQILTRYGQARCLVSD